MKKNANAIIDKNIFSLFNFCSPFYDNMKYILIFSLLKWK